MTLESRQKALLAAVVERYVENAEPVGSATLASDPRFIAKFGQASSATIRHELAELEACGLLFHPHTSAGRAPTDAGYRLYVNELLRPRAIRPSERARIASDIAAPASSVEDALREATATLARLTGYPAVASLPSATRDTMRHVQINPLPPRRLILILVTATGRIEHRTFDVEQDVPAQRLRTVANFLSDKLGGKPLSTVRKLSFEQVCDGLHDAATVSLARRAWDTVRQSLADITDDRIVVQGLITLLNEPEFAEIELARSAMELFEDQGAMSDLLRATLRNARPGEGQVHSITIGSEHPPMQNPAASRFSFVGVAYGAAGEVLGTVGVMGPKRMKYSDAVALIPALAARLQVSLDSL